MTIAERNNKLKHFITCLKCEVSGKCCDENCSTQYDAGNMGEIIENLEAISKILEQPPVIESAYKKKYQMIKEITDNWVLLPDSTVLNFKDVRTIKEIIDVKEQQ